jgi:membrane associated rhomboid family serine protease
MPLSDGICPQRLPIVNALLIPANLAVEGHYGLTAAHGHNDGTAFFAHIGGFVFGVIAAVVLVRAGKQQNVSAARGRLRLAT